MKLLTLSLLTALGTGAYLAPAIASPTPSADASVRTAAPAAAGAPIPAPSWAPRDTADTLWRRGRIAISDESWEDAAETFRDLVNRFPKSAYAGDALYWEAFALQRTGRTSALRRAATALERQRDEYPASATYTSGESAALLTRVKGRLARSGDREAAVDVAGLAEAAAAAAIAGVGEAMGAAAAELERVRPELERELAEARRELDRTRRGLARQGRDHDDIPPGCEDAVDDERVEALNALLQMNSEQALPILRKVLARRDKCSELMRRKAVFLVSQKRSDEAVDILVETAKTDPDRKTREDAVFWLSQTRSDRAAEVLEQILLKDAPDAEMQKKAVFSLSQTRTDRSARVLRDFVRRRDVDAEVRGEAIFWLGQSRSAENMAVLREIFATLDDDDVREKVIFAVAQHRSSENSRWLLDRAKDRSLDPDLRKSALFWAGQSGTPIGDLMAIYDSATDDRELREQVVFTLSQRRDGEGVEQLIAIARKEQDRELRKQAIFWLGQSRDPRAAKYLEELVAK